MASLVASSSQKMDEFLDIPSTQGGPLEKLLDAQTLRLLADLLKTQLSLSPVHQLTLSDACVL